MHNTLIRPLEIKELTAEGSFSGLASVYGNVDLGGDIVLPGAFKEFVKTKDDHIVILDSHQTRSTIGKGKLTDTHLGLAMQGQLNLKVSRARDVHELMKDNVIGGLSIGFDILPGGQKIREDGIRELSAIKLWEVSTTVFPMNQAAQVSAVKTLEKCTSVRDVEDLLRDAVGLSRAQAKLHAGAIWKTLSGQREADPSEAEVSNAVIGNLTNLFNNYSKEPK